MNYYDKAKGELYGQIVAAVKREIHDVVTFEYRVSDPLVQEWVFEFSIWLEHNKDGPGALDGEQLESALDAVGDLLADGRNSFVWHLTPEDTQTIWLTLCLDDPFPF